MRWDFFVYYIAHIVKLCKYIIIEEGTGLRNSEFLVVMRIARIMSLGKVIVGGDDLRVQT